MPEQLTCRLIRYQKKDYRASWLLTSLMEPDRFSRDELIDLYHRRWSIETIYREWKHGLDIQNLRSTTPIGIRKETHAQVLLSNLVRWIMTEACEDTPLKPVDLSFLTALTLIKDRISTLIHAHPRKMAKLYRQLLEDIRAAEIRKRPGRSYPRPGDGKAKYKGRGKYRQPAKIPKKDA